VKVLFNGIIIPSSIIVLSSSYSSHVSSHQDDEDKVLQTGNNFSNFSCAYLFSASGLLRVLVSVEII